MPELTPEQLAVLQERMNRYSANNNRNEFYIQDFNPNANRGIGRNQIFLAPENFNSATYKYNPNDFLLSGNGRHNMNVLNDIRFRDPKRYYQIVNTYFSNLKNGQPPSKYDASPEEFGLSYYYNPETDEIEFSYIGDSRLQNYLQSKYNTDSMYEDLPRLYQHRSANGQLYYYNKDENNNIDLSNPAPRKVRTMEVMNNISDGGIWAANYNSDFLNRGKAKEVNKLPNDPTKQAYGGYSGYRRYDDGGMMPPDQGMGGGSQVDQVLAMLSQLPPDQLQQVVQALMQMAQGGGMPQGDPNMGGMPPEQGMPQQGMMAYGGYNRYANGGNIQRTREQRLNYAFGGLINKYRK